MAGLREDALCSVQPPEPNHVKMSLKSHSPVSHENLLCSSPFRRASRFQGERIGTIWVCIDGCKLSVLIRSRELQLI